MRIFKLAAASVLVSTGLAVPIRASLIAQDDFESYSPVTTTTLAGAAGGTGWTGGWASNAASGTLDVVTHTLAAGGISGATQAARLQDINGGANAGYALSRAFTRQTGPVYASFLLRADNLSGNEFVNVYLSDGLIASGDANEMYGAGITLGGTDLPFFMRIGTSSGGVTKTTSIKSIDPVQDFLVVLKVTKTVSQFYQQADLWVFDANTTAPGSEPTPLASGNKAANPNGLQYINVRTLNIAQGETLLLDNIRIGTTWNSVTVPEPASFALGLPALLLMRRRREV